MTENYLKEVRNQYEEFPYPLKNPEEEKTNLRTTITEELSYISHYCFGGMKDLRDNCRFLVAGGGTGDAAIFLAEQLRDYNAEIIYVDLSVASQNIARERARFRGLEDRIQWIQGSLLSVGEMGLGKFDYVNASGVLHHLASPEEGLNALVSVMKPDGALGCMLYAKYGRMAVYQMQEALRVANHNAASEQEKVENAKIILNSMPSSNWFLSSPQGILDEVRCGDAAIYDLLLHSQDRSYSIPELYAYMRGAGLEISSLYPDERGLGKKQYDPSIYIKDEALLTKIRELPLDKQQQFAEIMNGKIFKHTFHAVRKPVSLPSITNLDMVPFMDTFQPIGYEDMRQLCAQSQGMILFNADSDKCAAYLVKTPHLELFLKYLDGERSMGKLVSLVQASAKGNQKPDSQSLIEEFMLFYKAMNEYSWMLLRHKNIPAYTNKVIMQERVSKLYA